MGGGWVGGGWVEEPFYAMHGLHVNFFYQEGDGVMSDELVLVSVAVTTFVSSFRIVVMIFLPLKIIGTSVEAVSVTVVMKVVLDSSVDHVGVGVTRMLIKFGDK